MEHKVDARDRFTISVIGSFYVLGGALDGLISSGQLGWCLLGNEFVLSLLTNVLELRGIVVMTIFSMDVVYSVR